MPSILVTAATGNIGGHIVSELLAKGVAVRAMVRNPETAGLPSQVEVRRGDLTDPDSVGRCLEGVDAMFLLWIAPDATVPEVIAHIARKVRRVVFLSNSTVRDDLPIEEQNYPVTSLHANIERRIAASGVEWTFLRPGAIATNALFWAPQIRASDVVRWPYAEAATSPIHEADIAAVAVRALCEDGHAGAKHVITGPESLTHRQQVRIIGEALGRRLRFEEVTGEAGRNELSAILPAQFADMFLDVYPTLVGKPALVTSTVAEVTGSPARSFRQWAADHESDFRAHGAAAK
jgi:uncharacterized protein YbjT (DUF2867 family)